MELTKGFKFKIIPDDNQETLIKKTFGYCRKVYNFLLGERNDFYEENKDNKEILKTFKYTTEKQLKEQFEFLKEVDSVALQQSRRHLNDAFDRFFKGLCKHPKFKSKKDNHNSYITVNQLIQNKYNSVEIIDNKYLKVPKLGKVRVKLSKQLPKNYKINNVTISRNPRGIYFVSINFTYEISNIQERVANQRKDFCHKKSKELTDDFDYIFVEDINLKGLSQCLKLGKSTNDNGFGMFRDFLSYKALEKGKVFYKINKWDPTSQTCHACGCKSPITFNNKRFRS